MGYILRLPSINAPTNEEKIEQIRRYLYQTIKEINWALNTLDSGTSQLVEANDVSASSTFALIKPMIMSSADIVNAYYAIMKPKFDDVYQAKIDMIYYLTTATFEQEKSGFDKKYAAKTDLNDYITETKADERYQSKSDMDDYLTVSAFDNEKVLFDNKYATKSHSNVTGSILAFAQSCSDGITPIATSSSTTELPDDFVDCVGTVQKISSKNVITITDFNTGNIATNVFVSGEWAGWNILTPQ